MSKTAIALLVVVIVYLGIIPMFWPTPQVEVGFPQEVRIGEDLELAVRVSAWHPLFDINRVRFAPDVYESSALDPGNPMYPLQPYGESPRRFGLADRFLLFTFPVTKTLDVTVPLGDPANADKLSPGELVGTMDVSYTYANYSYRVIASREGTGRQAFRVSVLPAR